MKSKCGKNKKVAHEAIAGCHWCHFDVFCDLLLNRRTATWNLFILYNRETNYHIQNSFISHYFNITRKPAFARPCAFAKYEKKAIWRNLSFIQNEVISLVAMRSKEMWLVQQYHATVKPDSSVTRRGTKTYSESRIELRNLEILKKNAWKVKSVFDIRAVMWAEKLGRCLEYCWSWKNTLGKFVVAVNQTIIYHFHWHWGE